MTAPLPPFDRSTPPAAGAQRPFLFPGFRRTKASQNLELLLSPAEAESAGGPLLHLELFALCGADAAPVERPGLAALTGGLLDEGTSSRSALEIATAVESLGGYLSSGAGWESTHVGGTFLAGHWRQGLELLAAVATDPAFDPEEIERLRRRTLAEIQNRRAQPGTVARQHLLAALYPESPYGHPLLGNEAGLQAIQRDEITAYYESVRSSRWVAVAVGGMDPERLAGALEEALPPSPRVQPEEVPPPTAPARSGRRILLVDRPGAAQTELRIGHEGLPRTHPDFTAAGLLNTILGGKFTSRINLNLRERHGYTYGAHTSFSARRGAGPFAVSAAVANPSAAPAAREILHELQRIRTEPVSEQELADAASYLLGVFPYTVQTIDGVAARLVDLATFALPNDYWDTLPQRISSLGRDDLLRVAAEQLEPDRAVIVAVGPAEELRSAFEELGEVEVVTA